jgi:hypothetical protein
LVPSELTTPQPLRLSAPGLLPRNILLRIDYPALFCQGFINS